MRPLPVLLLSIAASAAAQETYILPVYGHAPGFRSDSFANASVVNPNPTPVTLRFPAVYPARPLVRPCKLPDPIVLRPHETLAEVPEACRDTLQALMMVSDQPVEVAADVITIFENQCGFSSELAEHIDVAKDWLPAETDVLIPMLRMFFPGLSRANLFIVNPNDFVLVVSVHVERLQVPFARDLVVAVEPQSLNRTSLPVLPTGVNSVSPIVIDGIEQVTVRANAKFYAGVSAFDREAPVWHAPILLRR